VVQTEARSETGATMERMGEEEGIVPERRVLFRFQLTVSTNLWR
jgi:hypothetical protein